MYLIIWEYWVKADRTEEFEKIYTSNGLWAELFRKGAGYLGTELLRDEKRSQHFITIDRWDSSQTYESFRSKRKNEYSALDADCAGLTDQEVLIGKYETRGMQ